MKNIKLLLSVFIFFIFSSCEEDKLMEVASIQMNESFDVSGDDLKVSIEKMKCNVKVRSVVLVMSKYANMSNSASYDIPIADKKTVVSSLANNTTYYYYFKLANIDDKTTTEVKSFKFSYETFVVKLLSNPTSGGSVTGGGTYAYGKDVIIKATPASGYEFDGWSDGVSSSSRSILVTENKTLTANFVKIYTITLSSSPSSGGTVTGGGNYASGKLVTIKATPASGYVFTGWSDGNTSASRSFYITGDKTLTAYFTRYYRLTLSSSPSMGGSVTGSGTYESGKSVTIKATPASGYEFDKWSDGSTAASRSVYMSGDKTLTAYFKKSTTLYTLTLSSSPSYGGTVTGGGTYENETYATIKATPASGYVFDGWSDGYTSATRSIYMTGDKTITAKFVRGYTLTLTSSPSYGGSVTGGGTYEYGTYATIKATPASGYVFDGWSDGYTSATRSIYMTSNKTITAYFVRR